MGYGRTYNPQGYITLLILTNTPDQIWERPWGDLLCHFIHRYILMLYTARSAPQTPYL